MSRWVSNARITLNSLLDGVFAGFGAIGLFCAALPLGILEALICKRYPIVDGVADAAKMATLFSLLH